MTPDINTQPDLVQPLDNASLARQRFEKVVGIWFIGWSVTALLLVGAFIQYAFWQPAAVVAAASATKGDTSVLAAANQARTDAGLAPLTEDARLTAAAAAKAQDMLNRGYFGHFYGDTTPWQFIDATGDTNWRWAGENLAKNYSTPEAMVSAWLASPTHRANLLSDHYTMTGVASASGEIDGQTVRVTVQLFTGS